MLYEVFDLEQQIDRCERLARSQTDEEMRRALLALAEDYRARLKRGESTPFMLRDCSSRGGSAAGAR